MKNSTYKKLFLVLGIFGANQCVYSEEESRWEKSIKAFPSEMIEHMPKFFEAAKNDFSIDNLGYNSLGLACVLAGMASSYEDYFGIFSLENSYYSKIRKDGYETVIQYFIDNGCNIDEQFNFFRLFSDIDFDFSSCENIFKSLFAIAFICDEAMIEALIHKGFTIGKKDQLEMLLFFAKGGKDLLPIRCKNNDSLDWNNDNTSINYDSLVTFFKYCDQSVQKEFLEKHPEFEKVIKK